MRQGSKYSAGSAKKTKSLPQRTPQVTLVGPTHHHRHSKSGRQKLAGLEASLRKSWSEIEQSRRMSTSSIEISKRKQLADTETSKSTGRSSLAQDDGSSKMPQPSTLETNQEAKRKIFQLAVTATVCCTLMVAVIIVYIVLIWTKKTVGYCVSDSCKEHAERLRHTVNASGDPCNDFYAFVCSGWKRDYTTLSVLDKMNQDAKKNEIVELNSDMLHVGGASQLYYQCYEPSKVQAATNVEALLQFMDAVGLIWPVRDANDSLLHPLEVMLYMAAKYDTNFQFHLDVVPSKVIGPILIFRRRYHGVVWENRIKNTMNMEEYATVIRDHMHVLGLKNVQYNASLLRQLETFLIEATRYENTEGDQSWLAISQLDSKTPHIREVQWHELLNRQHSITLQRNWNPKDWVVVEDSLILKNIDELFRAYPDPQILMGTAWIFIQTHLWVAAAKPELMFRDNDREKVQLACLEYVNSLFGLLPSTGYLNRTYPTDEVRGRVYSFVQSLKNEFVSALKSSAWIDRESAEKGERKIKNTELNILPSEHFFIPLVRAGLYARFPDISKSAFVDSWLSTAEFYQKLQNHARFYDVYQKRRTFHQEPYAYTYLRNSVDAATAALDPPLFYTGGTLAMKYGGSGVLLAREIAKAIDPLGTTVNEYGENVTWWGQTLSAEYNQRLRCELGQAAGHRVMGIFPWIPALEVSFSAYKVAVQEIQGSGHSVQDLRVRDLEEYSDDQLFFMTHCYALCSKEGSQQECNVPLRHFYPFAEAFGCPLGSPMSANSKCTFFD